MDEILVEKNLEVAQLVEETGEAIRERTIGEERIGINFVKGNNDANQNLKEHFAHLINKVSKLATGQNNRQVSIAITEIENASMWATKALFNR